MNIGNNIKRLKCDHRYKEYMKMSGTHKYYGQEVVIEIEYVCVKCGKVLTVRMDARSQVKEQ